MFDSKKILLVFAILNLFVLVGCSSSTALNTSKNSTTSGQSILSKTFTTGSHNVSIMEIALPAEEAIKVNEISARFKSSVEKNQLWYKDYVSKYSNSGEKLPWNEKFGISKEEYNELITSSERMTLIEKKKTTVTIVKDNNGKLSIKANQDLLYLSGMVIDLKNYCLTDNSGVFAYSNEIKASDNQKVTGRWSGGAWKLNFEELKDTNNIDKNKTYGSITISIGQLEKINKMMVYYKERKIDKGQSYNGEETIIFND